MIDPADFEAYLKLEAEAEALKQKMIPHAEKVAIALYGQDAKITGFGSNGGKPYAFGYVSEDAGITIRMDLLYAADWEAQVAAHHERQRIRHDKLTAHWEKEKKEAEQKKDLEELARLQAKYQPKEDA